MARGHGPMTTSSGYSKLSAMGGRIAVWLTLVLSTAGCQSGSAAGENDSDSKTETKCTTRPARDWARDLGASLPVGLALGAEGQIVHATSDGTIAEASIALSDPDGKPRWQTPVAAGIGSLAATEGGDILAVGWEPGASGKDSRAWVALLDGDGDVAWTQTLGADNEYWSGKYIGIDAAGIVWVLGTQTVIGTDFPNPSSVEHAFIARLSDDGDVLDQRVLGESGNIIPFGLAVTPHEGAVAAIRINGGTLTVADVSRENAQVYALLIGFDADGNAIWSSDIGESEDDEIESLIGAPDGMLYATGTRARDDLGITANKIFVTAASSDGTVLWTRSFEEGHQMSDSTLALSSCGRVVLATNWAAPDGSSGAVLIDLEDEGAERRRQRYVGDDYVFVSHIAIDRGGLIVSGQYQGKLSGSLGSLEAPSTNDSFLARVRE